MGKALVLSEFFQLAFRLFSIDETHGESPMM